ncbi:hypothetical protein ACNR9V_01065 [Parageobacillus thermoglucosidasius]|uniref:hypothetical protein n=1 Tax=Parageobacillus thermoglucosidasius TaxID=1426 RepID=UPI003B67463A
MSKYKYQIENSVAMSARFARLLQQSDFENKEILNKVKDEKCHIYMICSRPRITFNPSNLKIEKDFVSGSFIVDKGEIKEEHFFKVPNPPNLAITSFEMEYPYSNINFLNNKGEIVSGGKAALLYPRLQKEYNSCLDLEVLYIGQAFGEEGERLATDRLASHSTLQKIYLDILTSCPNKDVWIILWQFEPYLISMMGSGFENALIDLDGSIDHFNSVLSSSITFDQQITFTEAALIRYFEPVYNKEYKTSFPSQSHSSYDQCYKLDINSVAFELDTIELITRLYSPVIAPSFWHTKHYPLYSEDIRKDMFKHFQK